MNDEMKERVSSILDGESHLDNMAEVICDEEARTLFGRYALISAAIRGELPEQDPRVLASSVSKLVAAEPVSLSVERRTKRSRTWHRPAAGMALAASVAGLAILGLRALDTRPNEEVLAAQTSAVNLNAGNRWNVQRPAVEARLNQYLVNHSEYMGYGVQGMLPYARIVSYDSGQ